MEQETKHYHLTLTDVERVRIANAVRNYDDGLPSAESRAERVKLADRIERARGEDSLLDLASSRLRAWYHGRVRGIAEDILADVLAGQVTELSEAISEAVDGTDIVVYTYKAQLALAASDNSDAGDDVGFEAPTDEQRAFCALEADVWESLRAHACYPDNGKAFGTLELPEGFDLDDPATWAGVTVDEDAEAEGRPANEASLGTADEDERPDEPCEPDCARRAVGAAECDCKRSEGGAR